MRKAGKPKAIVSWSSGKDSAFALFKVMQSGEFDVVAMLTTVTSNYDRVSMHGVRRELLLRQARSLRLPLIEVEIPAKCTNEIYEAKLGEAMTKAKASGVEYVIFGDIFLEDVRKYREQKLSGTGISPVFPLWGEKTSNLALDIIESGIRARVSCLDPEKLNRQLGGALFNEDFVESLPGNVDPCGENGEFHTFVESSPLFSKPIAISVGESVQRDRFLYTDLLPL